MKRLAAYFVSIAFLSVLFSVCYYWSYQNALKDFNRQSTERNTAFIRNLEEYHKQEQILLSQKDEMVDENSMSVDSSREATIHTKTKFYIISYDLSTRQISTEETIPPSEFIGLNRAKTMKLLSDYMENPNEEEIKQGLYAYELLTFSNEEVIVRKSYLKTIVSEKYCLVVEHGMVVIYDSDLETVFEYTDIEAVHLPEETRNELMRGIYVNNEDELYALLESLTS